MKTEIIIYGSHLFYVDETRIFLENNGFNKKYQIQVTSDLTKIDDAMWGKTGILILNLVGENIAEATNNLDRLLLLNKDLKIIVLSVNSEMKTIKKFFDRGVKGYLGKNTDNAEFLRALNQVIEGKVYINDDTKNELFNYICSVDEQESKSTGIEDLTTRELDVLSQICEGLRTKEIADKLFISTHTVESHRRNIMMKLNINNSSKLVKFAMDHSLVK